MNKSQAITKLKKLLGDKIAWREYRDAPSAEARAAAQARQPELSAKRQALEKERDERMREILRRDDVYQQLCIDYQAAKKASQENAAITRRYRIEVGTISGAAGLSFFHVAAQTDNWAEAVEKVTAEKAPKQKEVA